jgi:hypothetical protein
MTTTIATQSEYRNLPILSLMESPANPRRSFDGTSLNELADSIRSQGVLSPLLVRPKGNSYEIVAGARRYRAAQLAGLDSVPVRIVELTDAQALETSIVENCNVPKFILSMKRAALSLYCTWTTHRSRFPRRWARPPGTCSAGAGSPTLRPP